VFFTLLVLASLVYAVANLAHRDPPLSARGQAPPVTPADAGWEAMLKVSGADQIATVVTLG
jgi:hypothetical protein